jgi:hypothetical protein
VAISVVPLHLPHTWGSLHFSDPCILQQRRHSWARPGCLQRQVTRALGKSPLFIGPRESQQAASCASSSSELSSCPRCPFYLPHQGRLFPMQQGGHPC